MKLLPPPEDGSTMGCRTVLAATILVLAQRGSELIREIRRTVDLAGWPSH